MQRLSLVALVVGAVVGLGACTSEDAAEPKQDGPSLIQPGKPGETNRKLSDEEAREKVKRPKANQADVEYVQNMIRHHFQALEMTDYAATHASDAQVKAIAKRIDAGQEPEIKQMNNWLKRNDRQPVRLGEHGGHDHADMPGMASEEELKQLAAARGAAFDEQFLKLMITHHEGALTMAKKVQTSGRDLTVQEMADHVISSQSVEIGKMRQMQR